MDALLAEIQSRYALDSQGRLVSKRYSRVIHGGFAGKTGYRRVTIFDKSLSVRKNLLVHRVVWGLAYGALPTTFIDHIDGDRQNNTLSNLREVSGGENAANRPRMDTSTKVTGITISFFRPCTPFVLQFRGGGKNFKQRFATIDEAVAVRNAIWREAGIREEFITDVPAEMRPFLDKVAEEAVAGRKRKRKELDSPQTTL